MSKKFKGKRCVYCADAPSTTKDHIFAQEFFLERHRIKLPAAPACARCNAEKGKLEHYLTALLPFGACHPDAMENLATMVPKRLSKNARLHRRLVAGQGAAWARAGDLVVPTSTLPIDNERFERLFQFIAKGHTADNFVKIYTFTKAGQQIFDERLFGLNARERVEGNVGDGTFVYEGAQGVDCPQVTA
jgi:hypothetical protein